MGGLANVLGEAAGGYAEAANRETQRQFQGEMDRRGQIVGLLSKLAADESAHPEVRNRAFNMALEALHSPHTKQYKPDFNQLIVESGRGQQDVQPEGPPRTGQPSTGPQLQQPPQPPSNLYYTPEQQTAQAASRAGAITGAQQGAQLHSMVPAYGQEGEINMQGVSGTGQPIGPPVENAVVPQLFRSMASSLHPVSVVGPDGRPIPALQDKLGMLGPRGAVYDDSGNLIPNAQVFSPGLVPKSTSTTSTDELGMQRKSTSTRGPVLPAQGKGRGTATQPSAGGPRSQLSPLPQPPNGASPSVGGTGTASPAPRPAKPPGVLSELGQPAPEVKRVFDRMGLTPKARDVVSAAMDRMLAEGVKPGAKFNKVEQAAYTALQRQGLTPPMSATEATRTKADSARAILRLIADARRLIAEDPSSLGPLSGRWSQLEQKVGNLEGVPKELAGTLKSIYSVAGPMHGWRAMHVASEFERTYGGIQNTPGSLEAGLKAMENTAHAIIGSAYPGQAGATSAVPAGSPPPPGKKKFDWSAHPVIK